MCSTDHITSGHKQFKNGWETLPTIFLLKEHFSMHPSKIACSKLACCPEAPHRLHAKKRDAYPMLHTVVVLDFFLIFTQYLHSFAVCNLGHCHVHATLLLGASVLVSIYSVLVSSSFCQDGCLCSHTITCTGDDIILKKNHPF